MRGWLLAAAILVAPTAAWPCDTVPVDPYEIDPAEVGIDTASPTAAVVQSVRVVRAVQPLLPGRGVDSCGDGDGIRWFGEARLLLRPSTDDRTAADRIGYRVEFDGPHLPALYDTSGGIQVLGWDDSVALVWEERDDDDRIDFRVRLTPLDRAGNEGPATEVHVRDEGVGCAAAGGSPGALPLLAGAAALLGARRQRYRLFARERSPSP